MLTLVSAGVQIYGVGRSREAQTMKLSIALISLAGLLVAPLVAQSGRALIVQTNSAGDSVMLIDPATDKIVAEVPEAEVVHGAAAAPDGSRLYLSNESTNTLDIVDTKTMRIRKKIPLTDAPTTSRFTRTATASTWRSRYRTAGSM